MIRSRFTGDTQRSLKVQRGADIRSVIKTYPLIGGSEVISDSRPTLTKVPITLAKRRRRDPLGRPIVPRKLPRAKIGWQPYIMNPVVIQKFTISVPNAKDVTIPFYTGGPITYGPGVSSLDTKFFNLSKTTVAAVDANTEKRAIIKCLAKLSSPKHLDLGVGIAEIKQTAQFLKSPLSSLVKLFRKMKVAHATKLSKKRNRVTARDYVDTAADTWLSYRYAFNPLVGDVTGLMNMMSEKLSTESKILRRVSGRDKVEYSTTEAFTQTSLSTILTLYLYGYFERNVTQTITAVQLYRYKPYYEDAIALASVGLSPTQVVSTAWELTPFSFIVDWGVGVGDWLRAWEPKPWIQYLGSCVSTVTETTLTTKDFLCSDGNPKKYWLPGSTATQKQLSRVAKTLTLPRTPLISRDVLNLSRTLDALSLSWKPVSDWLTTFKRRR